MIPQFKVASSGMKMFLKILPWLLGALLLFYVGSKLYNYVYNKGANSIQELWDLDKKTMEANIKTIQEEYVKREKLHRTENQRISYELSQATQTHAVALANVRREYDQRMRNVEQRTVVYQRQAEGGATECRDLASHASRLDSTLEEGRSLVRELGETLRLRDGQVKALGNQIKNDRQLLQDSP